LIHVPGTFLLNESVAHDGAITSGLKHGTGDSAYIVLAPQPSNDPNDPLNWTTWMKDINLGILALGAILNAATIVPS
jgi:hypothetical protein